MRNRTDAINVTTSLANQLDQFNMDSLVNNPTDDDNAKSQKRLLHIDDDTLARRSLAVLLETWGYDVDSVDNAEDGLLQFSQQSYDLVITDMKMPVMDGLELTRQIKTMNPSMPVVVISGIMPLDAKSERDGFLPGDGFQPDCVLVKPLVFKEFAAKLRVLLDLDRPEPA